MSEFHTKSIDEATVPIAAGACRSMAELRAGIDRIDREIVALLAERFGYVRQAAQIKRERSQIVDSARIEDVVAKTTALAEGLGLAPELVESLYRLMIDRFIALEAVEFDRLQDRAE